MRNQSELKKTIEDLIKAGTTFDVEQLELIYHKELQVIMIDVGGQKMISNKESFKELFSMKRKNGEPPLNTWAEFYHIQVNDNSGHVIVNRKVNLTGEEQNLTLSIDLVWEADRWQVIREVIVAQPID